MMFMLLVPAFLSFLQLLRWSVRITHAREIPPARPQGDGSRSRARGCHTGKPGAPARSRPNSAKVQLFRETSSPGAPSSPLYFSSHSGKISAVAICCFCLPHILSLLHPPPILLTEPLFPPPLETLLSLSRGCTAFLLRPSPAKEL